ncbi:MAG: hypothetical protein RML94_15205 [Bacteroidia bacterium]|nr:hypothetical protein [Bacteroidia bacterium]
MGKNLYLFGKRFFWACPFAALRVGLLRTTLTLGATLRFALPNGMLRIPHAAAF